MKNQTRKRVGLALGGGVARGMAHIGVLNVLEKAGISVDFVAGTSAGSIVGAAYCAGMDLKRLKEIGVHLRWWKLARLVWPRRGLFSFEPLERWLTWFMGDIKIEDLKIPLAVVTTDIDTGEPVTFTRGRLAPAVRASCSVLGIIEPLEMDGRLLADGSYSNTVPVSTLRAMGAEYVIGVDIFTSTIRPRWGPFGMAFTGFEILIRRAGGGITDADMLIAPRLGGKTYIRFSKREEFYQLGEEAALARVEDLRAALNLDGRSTEETVLSEQAV